jgi:RNA polymerase sigma-70 factor (ECF subfamily)
MPETDVDDVVQETFIAAWRHLASYDPARPFRGWLFRIALNKMRDLRQRHRVRAFLFGAVRIDEGPDVADDAPDAERHVAATRELAAIRAKLRGLDGGLGEALVLTAMWAQPGRGCGCAQHQRQERGRGRVARARQKLSLLDQENPKAPEGKP